ncbi:hypothetical protein C1I92_12950 [Jiangella anatolica]|uniref:Asp/Glu racemase n=1 Tax=Jiangella anatolica TaxID=2670374 RepID=A0A2W2BSB6_9ACTN|nr:hypothetical protein C1I92_12950 [Jiangella anatolica]
MVLPSVNTVVEPFFAATLPAGLTVHAQRMPIGPDATAAAVERMDAHGRAAVRVLADCRPDAILYACTASGLVRGRDHDLAVVRELTELTGIPCLSGIDAVVRALRAVGARRLTIASPYVPEIDHMEVAYFESAGFTVAGSRSLGIADTYELATLASAEIAALAREAWQPGSDALYLACLNVHSHEVIAELEAELGVPVVSATQAALWAVLTELGVTAAAPGYGRLLAEGVAT